MVEYNRYPAMDADNNFPPAVRQALSSSPEVLSVINSKVTPLVVEALGKDASLYDSAERALLSAAENVDFVLGDDQRIAREISGILHEWAVTDSQGRAPLFIDGSGITHAPGGVETPSFNDLKFVELSPETGYVRAWVDSNMRAVLAFTASGEVEFTPTKTTINRIPIPKSDRTDPRLSGGADLHLIIGQSNAHGGGLGFDQSIDIVMDGLNQFAGSGSKKNQIIPARDSLFHYNQWGTTGSPLVGAGMEFGRQALLAAPSDRTILLVPAALGSTSISGSADFAWDPDNTTATVNLFKYAQAQLRAALATHPNNRVASVIWIQGEGDTGKMTKEQYLTKLERICDLLRSEFGESIPFLVGSMVPEWVGTNATRVPIDEAHRAIANTRPFAAYVQGPSGQHQDDKIHYNAVGYRELGRRLFNALTVAKAKTIGL